MNRDLQKTLKIIAVLLIMLTPLSMAACGKAETAAPVPSEVHADETEAGPRPAAASAEEIHPFENSSPQEERKETPTAAPTETGDPRADDLKKCLAGHGLIPVSVLHLRRPVDLAPKMSEGEQLRDARISGIVVIESPNLTEPLLGEIAQR